VSLATFARGCRFGKVDRDLAAVQGQNMSDSARATASEATQAKSAAAKDAAVTSRKVGGKPAMVAAIGALLVFAAAGSVAMKYDLGLSGIGTSGQTTISSVGQADLDGAAGTLTPAVAGGLIDDAKHCRVPLASMTIAKGNAQAGGSIRIRSGNYLSPWFNLTDGVQRIAVPYPAPYGAGSGVIVVEGDASGAVVGLTPTKVMLDLPTAVSIPVVWRPQSPC
jgi:hypothetical protein